MTTCAECCQELWGHEERFGLCVTCQRVERERIYDDSTDTYDADSAEDCASAGNSTGEVK